MKGSWKRIRTREIAEHLESGKIQQLKEWWEKLSPEQQDMIVKIGLIVAAIGPLLMVLGSLATAIGALMSPIGLVMLAIAALVAAGVWLYKHWDEVKKKAEEIWTKIKDFFSQTVENIKTKITDTWNNIKSKITEVSENIKTAISEKWEAIKTSVTEKWEAIKSKAEELWNAIKEKVINPILEAKQNVEEKIEALKTSVTEKWEALKTSIGNKVEEIKDKLTKPFKDAKEKIDEIVETIKGFFPINISNILSNIKLPHFRLVGSLNPTTWVSNGLPHIEVDWYKKAMERGMILDGATIFGMGANGNLLGGGEAGRELIVGVNSLQNMIRQSMAHNNLTTAEIYQAVKAGMRDANITVYMDGRKVTEGVNRQNDMIAQSRARMQGAY